MQRLQLENQNFQQKWPIPPTDYSSQMESFPDTINARQKNDTLLGAMVVESNNRIAAHLGSIDNMKAAGRNQIAMVQANEPIVQARKAMSTHVVKALQRFEGFMGSAVRLGYISQSEATNRVRGAEQDAVGIREEAPADRKKDFIDNLVAQIKDIMGRKN